MGDPKDPADEVVVDPISIWKLGTWFMYWATEFDRISGVAAISRITPGFTPEGKELVKRFDEIKGLTSDGLVVTSKDFRVIGDELFKIAWTYYYTDDLNYQDAERLRLLVDGVTKNHKQDPGINKTLPPAPGQPGGPPPPKEPPKKDPDTPPKDAPPPASVAPPKEPPKEEPSK